MQAEEQRNQEMLKEMQGKTEEVSSQLESETLKLLKTDIKGIYLHQHSSLKYGLFSQTVLFSISDQTFQIQS